MQGLKLDAHPDGIQGLVYITPAGEVLAPSSRPQYLVTLCGEDRVRVHTYAAGQLDERWPPMPAVEAGLLLMTLLTGYRYRPPPRHYPQDEPVAQTLPENGSESVA